MIPVTIALDFRVVSLLASLLPLISEQSPWLSSPSNPGQKKRSEPYSRSGHPVSLRKRRPISTTHYIDYSE